MVIKGKIRGNGRQLASYLLTMQENENIRILDVDGRRKFTGQNLRDLLGDFSLNEQLTRSRQGIYHAMLNPEEDYSREMTDREWRQAADILAKELGFTEQRRAIVLHTKYGRTHAHVAFERYDHEAGKMIPVDHNYRKHDNARAKMEQVFSQQTTPRRNPHRQEMKIALTRLWQEQETAGSFLREARKAGYVVSSGYDRMPFMVVDDTGQSFNLVRHLDGVRVQQVRERFKQTVLPTEKEAIGFIRTQETITGKRSAKARQKVRQPQNRAAKTREAFVENLARIKINQQSRLKGPRMR